MCTRDFYGLTVEQCEAQISEGLSFAASGNCQSFDATGVCTKWADDRLCQPEECQPCPVGAECQGKDRLPMALDGFWRSLWLLFTVLPRASGHFGCFV